MTILGMNAGTVGLYRNAIDVKACVVLVVDTAVAYYACDGITLDVDERTENQSLKIMIQML